MSKETAPEPMQGPRTTITPSDAWELRALACKLEQAAHAGPSSAALGAVLDWIDNHTEGAS